MFKTCKCGKGFITEADPYVCINKPSGFVYNCGCLFTKPLELQVKLLMEMGEFYESHKNARANYSVDDFDTPGLRYTYFLKARKTLAKIKEMRDE